MNHPFLEARSVGSLVKKIMEVNPDLGVQEVVQMVRMAHRPGVNRDVSPGKTLETEEPLLGFSDVRDTIDESIALEMAQASLKKKIR